MSKKLIGLTLALALFAVALPASAASLTQAQIQSILGLLQSFGAEQSVINKVSATLGGNGAGTPDDQKTCVQLTRNLTIGVTGEDVTRLQKYLAVKGFFSNEATGYYGFITAQAVGKLQMSLGIVSSQNDSAYGMMGPKTRQAIGCGNIVEHPESSEKVFSATPTEGVAPLKVQFTSAYYSTHDASEPQHYVRFGDESKELGRITCIKSNGSDLGSSRCLQWGVSHVYNTGTYTAELIRKVGSQAIVLSTLPIVVSGSNTGDIQVKNFSSTQSGLTTEFSAEVISGDWEKLTINFGDGTSGNMEKTVCPGITCFVKASHTYPRAGTYIAQLASKTKPSQVLGTATITATTNTVSFSATPTEGAAPLTVTFKIPVGSAGGDYFDFGDGTDACSIPGVTRHEGGCTAPINTLFSHTYARPGTYTVLHSRRLPSSTLGTATITVGQN